MNGPNTCQIGHILVPLAIGLKRAAKQYVLCATQSSRGAAGSQCRVVAVGKMRRDARGGAPGLSLPVLCPGCVRAATARNTAARHTFQRWLASTAPAECVAGCKHALVRIIFFTAYVVYMLMVSVCARKVNLHYAHAADAVQYKEIGTASNNAWKLGHRL
jgi:hypothetical protein